MRLAAMVAMGWMMAVAAVDAVAADAAAGKARYAGCASCHGAAGEGNNALGAPVLAGQDAAYIERQLGYFRSGVRGGDPADTYGAQMTGMAMTLPDAQAVADVAAWLAALPAPAVPAPPGDLQNGNNYYQGKCGACHGGKAEGNAALGAPRLAAQQPGYLRRQYAQFLSGARGAHPDDRYGRQMRMMAATMPEPKNLDDVLAWIGNAGSRP